jgi:hypothetical protein
MNGEYLLLDQDCRDCLLSMIANNKWSAWRYTMGGQWATKLAHAGLAILISVEDKVTVSLGGEMKNAQWCTWCPTDAAYEWVA